MDWPIQDGHQTRLLADLCADPEFALDAYQRQCSAGRQREQQERCARKPCGRDHHGQPVGYLRRRLSLSAGELKAALHQGRNHPIDPDHSRAAILTNNLVFAAAELRGLIVARCDGERAAVAFDQIARLPIRHDECLGR